MIIENPLNDKGINSKLYLSAIKYVNARVKL